MRTTLLFCLILSLVNPVAHSSEGHFIGLLSPSEAKQYQSKPDYRSRMDVLRKALERHSDRIRQEVRSSRYPLAVETLGSIEVIASHGLELTATSARPEDFRSKKIRKLEIRLRKVGEMLEDLQSAPPFEYRSAFTAAISALSDLRERLLQGYFQEPDGRLASSAPGAFGNRWIAASHQRGLRSTVNGDQFTAEEEDAIREAQEIKPRVETLLEIAEARLDEVTRRLSQQPWKGKEPNPLEFFTLPQIIRAYHRALEVLMINIDEKARYGLAKEKDIRKSLKLVNQKMQEFIPQLQPLRELAIERQDEDLFVEVRKAQRISDQALKGSQLGLGAPSQ